MNTQAAGKIIIAASGRERIHWAGRRRAALWLAGVLGLLSLLPIWSVRYPSLYDYQNHLLEAQIVARYDSPIYGYAPHYQVREGWEIRSNALVTLLLIDLTELLPVPWAGKIILTLILVVLAVGLALLLARLGRSPWLLLALPILAYNLTFSSGMLNWSFGYALIPWGLLMYDFWKREIQFWALAVLAALGVLVYMAHILAWALLLLVIFTLAASDRLPFWRFLLVAAAGSAAAPLLLQSRPLLALFPPLLAAVLWFGVKAAVRLKFKSWRLALLGATFVVFFLTLFAIAREPIRDAFPDVGYSPYTKLITPVHLFTLPYHTGAVAPGLEVYNLTVLLLVITASFLLIAEVIQAWNEGYPAAVPGWGAVIGLLAAAYMVLPTRTQDIILTEPRVLMVLVMAVLAGARLPGGIGRRDMALLGVLSAMAVLTPVAALIHAQYYDAAASEWAGWLAEIPPSQRVLVFSEPPTDPSPPRQLAQVLDQFQFASIYALEHGGFVSNSFFNGPLLPADARSIPPYWWDEFRVPPYLVSYCQRLKPYYDYVVVWNPRSPNLIESVRDCFGSPISLRPEFGLWQVK